VGKQGKLKSEVEKKGRIWERYPQIREKIRKTVNVNQEREKGYLFFGEIFE